MIRLKKFLMAVCCMAAVSSAHAAADLSGTASVNVTSDTAANAKSMAFDEARRQIITDALRQYAIPDQLADAVANASAGELTNLIASSSIDSEKLSDTTYSANITMTLDRGAAGRWMVDNNVQNWLPDGTTGDKFVVVVNATDPMAGWIELNDIARAEHVDLATKFMMGNQITAELPAANRAAFTIALREAGWRYSDQDGVLRIWK